MPLHLGLVDKQSLEQVHMVVHRSQMQGRPLLIRITVDFGAIFDKKTGSFKITDVCSVMQRCPSVGIDIVHVGMAILNNCRQSISFLFFFVA